MSEGADNYGLCVLSKNGEVVFSAGLGSNRDVVDDLRRNHAKNQRQISGFHSGCHRFIGTGVPLENDLVAFLVQGGESASTLVDFLGAVDFAPDILNYLLSNPFDGMTVINDKEQVVFMSPIHEKFFGLKRGEASGRHVTEVIENTRLHLVARSGKAEIGQMQKMQSTNRIVSRLPILRDEKVVGAIGRIMFKGPEQLVEMGREITSLRNEVEFYKREASYLRNRSYGVDDIIGESGAIRQLKSDMAKIAALDIPVLVVGESGTGKELVAQAIHRLSLRRDKQMIMVNAGALPENLVESELFGYEAGAFTGAKKKGRKGKFEAADDSSLFLDEIGEMPLEMQVKLLRVLQDGSFERVGGDEPRYSDFRLIAATNRDLTHMIDSDQFRLDLYYRISGVTLKVPPLRERLEDIPLLVQHFIRSFAERQRTPVMHVNPAVYRYLQDRAWPGNIRQLQHEVERALIFSEGAELTTDDFRSSEIFSNDYFRRPAAEPQKTSGEALKDTLERVELEKINDSMARHNQNKKRVAEELGVSRSYLYKRLRELQD